MVSCGVECRCMAEPLESLYCQPSQHNRVRLQMQRSLDCTRRLELKKLGLIGWLTGWLQERASLPALSMKQWMAMVEKWRAREEVVDEKMGKLYPRPVPSLLRTHMLRKRAWGSSWV